MKKKVLFILPSFDIGGTTASTRNLISVLDKQKYEMMVWALNDFGILRKTYDDITLLKTCFTAQVLALEEWRMEKGFARRIIAALIRFTANHFSRARSLLIQYAINKSIGNQYFDTVVACQEGFTTEFTSHISCNNLVAWVRCDYQRYFKAHKKREDSFYEKFNHIVCVSEQTCIGFIKIYPKLNNRTICIYNPQDSAFILSQADIDDHDIRFKNDRATIVSVGRFSYVKRFVEIPSITRKLLDDGLDFTWYIIGNGEQESAITTAIKNQKVGDRVLLLGAKSNPLYYIKRANLYVCLSSSEACPRVINEAKILGTPVISTNFPTVYEYLEDGVNGRIVQLEAMSQAIKELLTDEQQYSNIKREINKFKFDNNALIKQLEIIL